MPSFTLPRMLLLLCPLLYILFGQELAEQILVTYDDLNYIFSEQHPIWPPRVTPPPSNIPGLTLDDCYGSADCVAPRFCDNCPSLPCQCMPPSDNGVCSSSSDCDSGEHCEWAPDIGFATGVCLSSRKLGQFGSPILEKPVHSVSSLLGLGLTGDRCFSTSDCSGGRNCVGDTTIFGNVFQNVSVCQVSFFPCICTPAEFIECSSSSDCVSFDEICASVSFETRSTYSYNAKNESQTVRLAPLCISPTLLQRENIVPISTISLMDNQSELPTASIQHPVPFDPTVSQPFLNVSPDTPPFSVSSLPVFNSVTTNELANDFIGGILSLIVVALLHRIFRGLIYFFPGIHHHGYSSYIIFSRLASFRNLFRLVKRREPFASSRRPREHEEVEGYSFKIILFPLLALVFLYVAEFVTIIAGTQVRSEFFAEQNFDPKISVVHGIQRPRSSDGFGSDCDDFYIPTRGLLEYGKVLKCVSVIDDPITPFRGRIRLSVRYFSGRTVFFIYSRNGSSSTVELSTSVRSKGRVNMKTMPFRPDILSEQARNHLLNSILNGIRRRLGYSELDQRHTLWAASRSSGSEGAVESIDFDYFHDWDRSLEMIRTALIAELRYMDLVLNSTGRPWVFTRPYTFEQMNPAMAVVKQYRIANGWLVIALVVVSAIQFVVNSRVTHFDEVAFVAMKELMGEDCVLGPLVTDGAIGTEVDLREGRTNAVVSTGDSNEVREFGRLEAIQT